MSNLFIRFFLMACIEAIKIFVFIVINPPPENVSLTNISVSSAVVSWSPISQDQWKHDNLRGYRVILSNTTNMVQYNVSVNESEFFLRNLLHETRYEVSVKGLGVKFEGKQSDWIVFQTNGKIV